MMPRNTLIGALRTVKKVMDDAADRGAHGAATLGIMTRELTRLQHLYNDACDRDYKSGRLCIYGSWNWREDDCLLTDDRPFGLDLWIADQDGRRTENAVLLRDLEQKGKATA